MLLYEYEILPNTVIELDTSIDRNQTAAILNATTRLVEI